MSILWDLFRCDYAACPPHWVTNLLAIFVVFVLGCAAIWVACAILMGFLFVILEIVDFWKTHKRTLLPIVVLAMAMVLLSGDIAMAQVFGGGGGDFLGGIRQFAMGPMLSTVLIFAVIGVGVALMVSHHVVTGLFVLAGAWIWANADTIAGMLH